MNNESATSGEYAVLLKLHRRAKMLNIGWVGFGKAIKKIVNERRHIILVCEKNENKIGSFALIRRNAFMWKIIVKADRTTDRCEFFRLNFGMSCENHQIPVLCECDAIEIHLGVIIAYSRRLWCEVLIFRLKRMAKGQRFLEKGI